MRIKNWKRDSIAGEKRAVKSSFILFEKSTPEFHQFPEQYLHKFRQKSDTGIEMNLLQEFIFVALDIYKKNHQNKDIKSRIDGWLRFLSSDNPEDIVALIKKYPDFKELYGQVYEICRNIEQVMGMFSEELYELDRNTVQYMIDELQEENKRQKEEIERQREEIERQKNAKQRQKKELERIEWALQDALRRLEERKPNDNSQPAAARLADNELE